MARGAAGTVCALVVWLNGTFGVGKTTTAAAICEVRPDWRVFDPEWVGYMLRANLTDLSGEDFQDLESWRRLVPVVMHEVEAFTGQRLVAVQSVLVEAYWRELRSNCRERGLEVVHVVLDCDESVLLERVEGDEVERDARQWRIDHIPVATAARAWMTDAADVLIDTTAMSSDEVASAVLETIR